MFVVALFGDQRHAADKSNGEGGSEAESNEQSVHWMFPRFKMDVAGTGSLFLVR